MLIVCGGRIPPLPRHVGMLMLQVPFPAMNCVDPHPCHPESPDRRPPGLRSGREGTAPPHSEVRNCLLLPRERTVLKFKNPCPQCEFLLNSTRCLCKKRWITRKTRSHLPNKIAVSPTLRCFAFCRRFWYGRVKDCP